ncbi:SDR family NAD(P)-dependent oxidoreductase [Microbacterium sp. BWT-B31]|uniref:SDR family NAD(P)-dependent oxidoreductase n=1 Tax=Microbacterium sp. BWT-B31 TaxID=3232072 RepID=UPI003528D35C
MTERRVAIVTGAAGGLGRECARVLADDGYAVFLLDRNAEGLQRVADELAAAGAAVDFETCDLTDADDVARAIDAHSRLGSLGALINVAGVWAGGTVLDVSVDEWDQMLGVKLRGDFLTTKAAVPWLRDAGGGAIVNISSMSGRTKSVQTSPAYVSANAGIIGLTMSTANQHAKDGIRVNAIAPGMIRTPMLDNYTEAQLEAIRQSIPLGFIAEPSQIASVVSFLVSDKAAYITGETINANGGMFMM